MTDQTALTHVDLFAGVGGFSLGFGQAGVRSIAVVELDRRCRSVLRLRCPEAVMLPDVRLAGADNLPWADIISFGSPCQDLSVAGQRAGIKGERSGLFFEAVRIVRELRPTIAVWENVPGLLTSNGGRDFGTALDALADAGALDIAWGVLDSQWFNVAQRRDRVFVVCDFGGHRAAEILSVPHGRRGDTPPRREAAQEVAAPLTGSFAKNHGRSAGHNGGVSNIVFGGNRTGGPVEVSAALNAHGSGRFDFATENFVAAPLTAGSSPNSNEPGRRAEDDVNLVVARTLAHSGTSNHGDHTRQTYVMSVQCHGSDVGPMGTLRKGNGSVTGGVPLFVFDTGQGDPNFTEEDIAYSLHGKGAQAGVMTTVAFTERTRADGRNLEFQEEVSYALTNPGDGGRPHSRHVAGEFGARRLTPVECCRLQGFPDDWNEWGLDEKGRRRRISDTARYKQMGNAATVTVTRWIGEQIVSVLGRDKR